MLSIYVMHFLHGELNIILMMIMGKDNAEAYNKIKLKCMDMETEDTQRGEKARSCVSGLTSIYILSARVS